MTVAQDTPVAEQGLFARIFGVLVSPRATYAAVAAKPRSLGVLYRRRTGPIATTMLGLYVAIALLIAFFRSGS